MTRRFTLSHAVTLSVWFVVLWLMLWTDISVGNVVSGVLVALVVVALTRRITVSYPDAGGYRISPIGLVVFVGHVIWSLVKSNLFLAWEIVTPTNTIATGNVEVELRSTSPAIAMAVSNVVTLTPGTVTVDISDDSSVLTIAVLHLDDPDEVRRSVRRTERFAIRAFGSRSARQTLVEEVR